VGKVGWEGEGEGCLAGPVAMGSRRSRG
jgi:hypothetical protein